MNAIRPIRTLLIRLKTMGLKKPMDVLGVGWQTSVAVMNLLACSLTSATVFNNPLKKKAGEVCNWIKGRMTAPFKCLTEINSSGETGAAGGINSGLDELS